MPQALTTDTAVREQHQLIEQVQANPYFKGFNPRMYPAFEVRHYAPVKYLEQVGIEKIGELVQHNYSLGQICALLDVSTRVMRRWIQSSVAYQDEITNARAFAADEMVHENLALARCAPDLDRAKLIISTQQWTAERWHKDMYGTKQVKVEGSLGFGGVSFQINLAPPKVKEEVKGALEGVYDVVQALPAAPQAAESVVVEALKPSLDWSEE